MDKRIGEHFQEWATTLSKVWKMLVVLAMLIGAIVPYIIGLANSGMAWYWIILLPLAILLLVCFSFWQFHKIASERDGLRDKVQNSIEFYPNRSTFTKSRGGLLELIEPYREIWMAWWTGSKTWQSEVFTQPNIKKLIIQPPGYDLVETFSKAEKGDIEVYRRNIIATTSNALDNNVSVVWAREAIIGMIIALEKDKGWARVEYFIPHSVTPDAYPSFVVYENNKNETELYERLRTSYTDMFDSEINVEVTKGMVTEWKRKLGMQTNQD